MARLLLQMAAASVNATSAPPTAAHSDGSGIGKSGIVYTFTFIGASVLAGLLFLALMFKYIIKYRMWQSPVTIPLQPVQKPEDEYISDIPNIKQIVVISNPDGCASIAIVREDKLTDGRPPFLIYETMVSKKAFADFSQTPVCTGISSTQSMTHAASASDLAGMDAKLGTTLSQKHILPGTVIHEDKESN